MPKKPRTFREPEEVWAALDKYAEEHKQTTTEALEKILLSPISEKAVSPNSGASDLLPCKQRLGTEPDLACLNPPTLYRKVKITKINAEICRACQVLSKNLPEKYAIPETEIKETTTQDMQKQTHDPHTDQTKDGKIWCPEGLWVFKDKCEKCRTHSFAVWYDCRKQHYAQKGKELSKYNTTLAPPGANSADMENQTKQCPDNTAKKLS